MAGINLSQSLQEKQALARGSFFDTGLFINIFVLFLCLAVYGGVHYLYLASLEKDNEKLSADIDSKMLELRGADAVAVADFRERLDNIRTNITSEPDPNSLFTTLEGATLPNVRLTSYEENWENGTATVDGVTDNLKYVAQQMIALKKYPRFQKVSVGPIKINDDGKVEFSLNAVTLKNSQ